MSIDFNVNNYCKENVEQCQNILPDCCWYILIPILLIIIASFFVLKLVRDIWYTAPSNEIKDSKNKRKKK